LVILGFLVADTTHSELEERWFSIGLASTGALMSGCIPLDKCWSRPNQDSSDNRTPSDGHGDSPLQGVGLSQLLTDVLKRDIEINEALK
jgi:hypothetical protein